MFKPVWVILYMIEYDQDIFELVDFYQAAKGGNFL